MVGGGDVNADGFADLIVGAYQADPGGKSIAGESYVVFGKADGFSASFNLSSLDGSNGFRIEGVDAFDLSGVSVSGAGDVKKMPIRPLPHQRLKFPLLRRNQLIQAEVM